MKPKDFERFKQQFDVEFRRNPEQSLQELIKVTRTYAFYPRRKVRFTGTQKSDLNKLAVEITWDLHDEQP